MANFFDKFPKTPYVIDKDLYKVNNYDSPVNILVRIGVIKSSLDAAFNYAEYSIQDGDTPEILAERVYGDPELHWLILLTNDIYDPNYDWPLNYDAFGKYLISKYGSVATAQTQVHHYEKIVKSVDVTDRVETNKRFQISSYEYFGQSPFTTSLPDSPTTYYSKTINGKIVNVYDPYRSIVYAYDWEIEQNENKRNIKIIKPDYLNEIKSEFNNIMMEAGPTMKKPGIRSLI